jgi:hypothetical protein
MLVLGVAGLAAGWWLAKHAKHLEGPPRLVRWVLIVGLIGLPGLQLATVFFYENTLTDGTGIEHSLAAKLAPLINAQRTRDGKGPVNLVSAPSDAELLRQLSLSIIQDGLLHRDLVLTGSCISKEDVKPSAPKAEDKQEAPKSAPKPESPKKASELPSDLYFYASADPNRDPPRYGNLGIRLTDYPEILVDVVMGSGSIFPVFPARTLIDFPGEGDHVKLVDGGFAHNSPIEAAWLWGATHIILIEASPSVAEREGRRNFLQNSIDAFNHLYYQAQLADARSKEKVTIFTLRPQPPHICVLDFANILVERAIDAGHREARGEIRSGSTTLRDHPSWEKGLGEPVFHEVH